MGLSSTRNPVVGEANRSEKREAENHTLESQKHAENAEKGGSQQRSASFPSCIRVAPIVILLLHSILTLLTLLQLLQQGCVSETV